MDRTKSLIVYITVNKDNSINMSLDKPKKENGCWIIKKYFVNNSLYNNIVNVVRKSEMTCESEPEMIEITIKGIVDYNNDDDL